VHAGFCDWRLPSRIELTSLIDVTKVQPGPTFDLNAFPSNPGGRYWTSSTLAGSDSYAWYVGFDLGDTNLVLRNNAYRARCVRGSVAAPPARYTVGTGLETGTVLDNATGLRWERVHSATVSNFPDAALYCAAQTTAGFTDWRVPSLAELQTLVDESWTFPAIDYVTFPGLSNQYFWTSSEVAGTPDYAWLVSFGNGESSYASFNAGGYSRCVR
jgi:hypothetical protein